MRKYQKVETTKIMDKETSRKITSSLRKTGKGSLAELTDEERAELLRLTNK